MARALTADPISQLEENLECTVCLEVLKDPRTLPCCHSFCKDCLEGVVKTCRDKVPPNRPIREIPCPACRTTFTLDPDKHVADMPRNHFICNLVQVAAVLDRGIGVPCSHNCTQSYSVARCVTCEKFLCRECLTIHNSYRGHNGHSVMTMEELSKPENRKKINDKMYCNEHSGMILKVYCETCDQLICRDCMDFKHLKQGHSCFLVNDVANNYKELLASNNKAMEDALTEGNEFLERLRLATERLDRDSENIKSQIVQKNDLVMKTFAGILKQKTMTLLNEVDEIHKAERAKLDRKTEETKLYVENVKVSVQLSETLVDQGTEEEIISSQKMMLDNANYLLTKREEHVKAPIPVVKLSYTFYSNKEPINEEILTVVAKSLGEVNGGNEDSGKAGNNGNQSSRTKRKQRMLARRQQMKCVTSADSSCSKCSESDEETGPNLSKGMIGANSSNEKSTTGEKLSCILNQSVKISVYQGDITEETADAIVNPANEHLKHSAGAAEAIVKAGGKSIQDESDDIMKKRRHILNPGEVVVTKAGNLYCSFIIHVVGPRWDNYYQKDTAKEVLLSAVLNCLTKASCIGATSISVPAIGSGIFRVPVQICADVLFTAAINFAQNALKSNSLKDIRFVDINGHTSQVFAQEMKKRFGTSICRRAIGK